MPHRPAAMSRSPRQSRQKQVGPESSGAPCLTAHRAPNAGHPAPDGPRRCWWVEAAMRLRTPLRWRHPASRNRAHAREMRVGDGRAQRLRTDSTFGEEKAKTLRVAGDKRERLNRNDFSYFTGIVNRLFQRQCLPFRKLWSLLCDHHARVCGTCSSKRKPLRIKMALQLNGLERIWR